jgi:hypothetical protein
VGASSVGIEGVVGASASLSGTDLRVNAKGRDLSELSDLVRTRLPAGPYALKGRLRRLEDRLAFEDMVLHAGGLDVDGTCALAIPPRLDGLQATFRASGPDLSKLSVLAAVKLPEAPFAIEGRMAGRGMAIDLDGVKGRLGDSSFDLRGSLVPAARLLGSDLHVTITGADLRASAAQAGLGGQERIPADAFDLSGRVRVVSDGYEVEGIQAKVGRLSAEAGGRLGLRPLEDATSLDLHVQGPALSDLGRWGAPPGLPDDRFNARGRLRIIQGVERVDQVAVEIGDDRVEIYGALGPLSDLSATNAAVNVTGPRFTDLFRFAPAAGVEIPSLEPMGPYSFSGRVLKAPAALELQEAILRVENAEIRIDGLIGTGARFRGTDIHVAARAPDASFAKLLAHRTLPEGPVEVRGGFKRDEESVLLDGLSLSIGDARAEVSGRIVPAPGSTSADLDVMVAGPHLDAILGPISGVSPLPPDPFELSARLSWTPGRISSSRLAARLGDSDLEGTMTIHREGRPVLEADLQSNRLAVSQLIAGFLNPSSSGGGPSEARSGRNALLFPDRPLRLEPLKSFDARIRLKASVTEIHGVPLNDVTLEAGVRDGVLSLDHAEGTGRSGGHATAMLRVEPRDAGYRLEASAGLAGGRLHLPKMKDAEEKAPSLDVEIEFEGEGRSLHQIAASSEGRALVALGPGKVPRSSEVFTSDILAGLLNALNPFSDAAPYTDFECGVLAAGMENGKAVVQPIAARSDKLTIVGRGRIDFETEEIDLVWTLKPRKGVGISAASIANPYVKLGGTLASPSLDAKPLEAAASTGAAVATAGLTILFKGLYDRITAEKKVCVNALEEAERREQERAARKKE